LNRGAWNKFEKARERFRVTTEELSRSLPGLKKLQQELAETRANGKNSSYVVETPVVYNSALDDVNIDDEIKLILVADNPGRREQASENRRYLVGPSGKIAKKFFIDNPQLGIDFTKNVIILNKTPIHTPRTNELRQLCKMETDGGGRSIAAALEESQRIMASLFLEFHTALNCPVWIIGYCEMRKGGIFEVYTKKLKELYADNEERFKQLYFYRHFSMNQFTIDLKQQAKPDENVKKSLACIGEAYRKRILGK
jgi:hypothetical protein